MRNRHDPDKPDCPLCAEKLQTAHPVLQAWFLALKKKHPTVHISWAYRGEAAQNHFLKEGLSRVAYPNSFHNRMPSEALDLFQIDADGVARWSVPFAVMIDKENEEAKNKIYSGRDIRLPGGGRDYLHFFIRIGEHV